MTVDSATVRAVLGVEPATLRQWATRGHIVKTGRDAYDVDSIKIYMARRYRPRGDNHQPLDKHVH